MKYDVFLSYSRRNAVQMTRVKDALQATGLQVWTDERLVAGTASWKNAIEAAIRDSKCVVVLMSPPAKASEWIEREIDYAYLLKRQIFPVLVDGNLADSIPFELINMQYVDIRRDFDDAIQKLINAIQTQTATVASTQEIAEGIHQELAEKSGDISKEQIAELLDQRLKAEQGSRWESFSFAGFGLAPHTAEGTPIHWGNLLRILYYYFLQPHKFRRWSHFALTDLPTQINAVLSSVLFVIITLLVTLFSRVSGQLPAFAIAALLIFFALTGLNSTSDSIWGFVKKLVRSLMLIAVFVIIAIIFVATIIAIAAFIPLSNEEAPVNVFLGYVLQTITVLLIASLLYVPLLIGKVAQWLGRRRLIPMLLAQVLFGNILIVVLVYVLLAAGDLRTTTILGISLLLGSVAALVPSWLFGIWLGNQIEKRFAEAVADTIAAVVAGALVNFSATFFFMSGVALFMRSTPIPETQAPSTVTSPVIVVLLYIAIATFTSLSAWLLLGTGSMETLRQRKGTILGLIAVALALIFSTLLSLIYALLGPAFETALAASIPETSTIELSTIPLLVQLALTIWGSYSILSGMLVGGFTAGVLQFVERALYFGLLVYGANMLSTMISMTIRYTSIHPFLGVVLFALLFVLSVRLLLFEDRVLTLLTFVLVFVVVYNILGSAGLYTPMETFFGVSIFVFFFILVGQVASFLRPTRIAGLVTAVLFLVALVILFAQGLLIS